MPLFLGLVFASAFIVALLAILLIRRFWTIRFGEDRADGVRKTQKKPVLRIGGISLVGAFLVVVSACTFLQENPQNNSAGLMFLLLGLAIFLVGFLDDLYGLPAMIKFAMQVAVGLGAYMADMRIEIISNPFGEGSIELGGFALICTVLWFVAIPNLINLCDGMDGLAGGVGLFLSLTLGIIGVLDGQPFLATMGLGFSGGMLAFLIFNFPPAKIYMGDGGAYLIGYFIAAVSLITSSKGAVSGPLLVVALGLGYPILDTSLTIIRRVLIGMPVMESDARHLHHRLLTLGFSKRTILMVLYGVFGTLAILGLALVLTSGNLLPVVGMFLMLGLFLGLKFHGIPHNMNEARSLFHEVVAARKDVRYAYAMAQVLEHDLDRVSSADVYWGKLIDSIERLEMKPIEGSLDEWEGDLSDHCIVLFAVSQHQVWQLYCPATKRNRRQWERIVRCFHLAIMNGVRKWGPPPAALGVCDYDPGTNLEEIEDRVNEGEKGKGHQIPVND